MTQAREYKSKAQQLASDVAVSFPTQTTVPATATGRAPQPCGPCVDVVGRMLCHEPVVPQTCAAAAAAKPARRAARSIMQPAETLRYVKHLCLNRRT